MTNVIPRDGEYVGILTTESSSFGKRTSGRRDARLRPGRGRRGEVPVQKENQQAGAMRTPRLQPCYKISVSQLPAALRAALPRWARCGIEQGEDHTESRAELPRRTRCCFVQPYVTVGETNEVVEWSPDSSCIAPAYYKVAATPDALRAAALIKVLEEDALALAREIVNAEAPSHDIRVAPAYFLTEGMRAMMAPGVSFPDDLIAQEAPFPSRTSIARGEHVALSEHLSHMRIEELPLSDGTVARLKQAGVTTLGMLLELEENQLGEYLEDEMLWEVYVALLAQRMLPTPSGALPAARPDIPSHHPIFEEFYFYSSGVSYEDEEQGQLILVHASVLLDRLTDERSGPVHTVWLTHKQIGQSLCWERELEHLDTHELRSRVNAHAIASGAHPPMVLPRDEIAPGRRRRQQELEEQYNLVPLKHEMFVSREDLDTAEMEHKSPTATVLSVLERYLQNPGIQPIGQSLSVRILKDMQHWIREDRKRQRKVLPSPASPTIVKHQDYRWETRDKSGGVVALPVLTGYRLLIGVLATTPVPAELILKPRQGKPQCTAPARPIGSCRTPHYVQLADIA